VSRRLFAFGARAETTYGVYKTVTFATNGYAVRTIDRPEISRGWLAENLRDTWFTGGLGELAATSPSGEFHELDVEIPIHGAAAAYATTVTPNIHPFLLAAGFSGAVVTTTGTESWTYTPTDSPGTGLSMLTRMEGKQYQSVGGVVTSWSISAAAGEYVTFGAKIFAYAPATTITEVSIGTIVLPTTAPIQFKQATATISSYAPVMRSFEWMCENTYAARGDGLQTKGHAGYRITRRRLEFRPVVEHADITNYNPEGDWDSSTQRTLDMALDAQADYNRFTINVDDARVIDFSVSDGDGLALVEPVYRCFTPSSGAEFTIVFDK
jgi:hypothetical protein